MIIKSSSIFVIIIIWIMSPRWAGDEIMNNPTIKSHIYMGLAAPTSDNYSGDDDNHHEDYYDYYHDDYEDYFDNLMIMIMVMRNMIMIS